MPSATYFQIKKFILHIQKDKANAAKHKQLLNLCRAYMGLTMLSFQLSYIFKLFHSEKLGKIEVLIIS